MHDGYYRTLEDVVWHYNNGGDGQRLATSSRLWRRHDGETDAARRLHGCPARPTPRARAAQIKPLGLTEPRRWRISSSS